MNITGAPSNQLDPRAKKVWRIYAFAVCAAALLICVALAVVMVLTGGPTSAWLVPLLVTLVVVGLWIALAIPAMYRRWRWEITDVAVRLQRGLIIVRRTVIPMARIQHVDTSQGPVLRMFDLSEVHVATAAGKHKIPMLADADAAHIRDRIAALAQVTDDGGL